MRSEMSRIRNIGIVAAWLVLLAVSGSAQGPQVTIPGLGVVEGTFARSYVSDRRYSEFRGVPYANPPIGNLRFQPPAPVDPWDGVLLATRLAQKCAQTGLTKSGDFWSWQSKILSKLDTKASDNVEDCLYLHIYTPEIGTETKLPVVLFIHGGSFKTGSALIYGPEKFMDEEVVLIVPHYRLGPIGFLSLDTDTIPGNAGMLDQVAALQWVKNNIVHFGGDPNKITIMGESAGGASSSLLSISPLSTGLFQQYIAQSGAAVADWAIDYDNVRAAEEIGRLAGCTDPQIPALTSCLMTVDAMQLLEAYDVFEDNERLAGRSGFAGCSPVIQKAGSVRFIEKEPLQILQEGSYIPKPALFGSNKHEGTLIYAIEYVSYLEPNGLIEDEKYLSRGITNFLLKFFNVKDQGETLAAGVEKAHFGVENMGNLTAMTPGLIDFLGNMFLKGPTFSAAQINAQVAPTFLYSFNFLGNTTLWNFIGEPTAPIPGGVCHANELVLQFKVPLFGLNAEEREMSKKIIKLWTNFATYGEPNPSSSPVEGVPAWPRYDPVSGLYMRLDTEPSLLTDYTDNEYFVAAQENFPW